VDRNQLSLTLLKMHRETWVETETEIASQSADEIRARLIDELKRLKARNDEQDSADAGRDCSSTNGAAEQGE
jgi:hypothetical protein